MRRPTPAPSAACLSLLLACIAAPLTARPALAERLMPLPDDPSYETGEREHPPLRVPEDELEAFARAGVSRAPVGARLSRFAFAPNAVGGGATTQSGPPPGLDWIELGPRPITNEYWSGNAPASGRVNSIAIDPRNGSVVYIAAAQGGVWKSSDAGSTWAPLTEGLSSLASGSVALDPQFPDVVYYGTGEENFSIDSFYGDGLFRSENGGGAWTKVANAGLVGSYIARVAVAPDDANTIYVAGSRGVVVSSDRGVTWTQTLAPNNAWATDLVLDPLNAGVVYAAARGQGVFRSADHGATWALLAGGLPTTGFDRINIAIAPSNPLVLYASFVATGGTSGKLLGMYRTADGGTTWSLLSATPEYLGGQGWYDNCVVVKPTDANVCYAGGEYPYSASVHGVIKTTNGGTSWNDVTIAGATRVHPDQHFLAYGPNGVLWLGNDGGVWKSINEASSWVNCNPGLGITEFYTVAKHPTDPTGVIGGTQDNGTARYSGVPSWPELISGDGGPVTYLKDNPSVMFSTYVYMNPTYKWTNGGTYLGDVTGGWNGAADRVDWSNGPLVSDPQVPGTIYVGTYRVWRSANQGAAWNAISGDLTGGGVLRAIAVGIGAPNTLWVGTSDGRVQVTTDGGASWFLRNAGLPGGIRIRDIALDPATPLGAWTIADRASSDRVFYTADGGVTWNTITGALPAGLRPLSLLVDPRAVPARLYVGTDYGVYVSTDGGATWLLANSGMPTVPVYQFALDTTNNQLVIATHGRGMWKATPDIAGPTLSLNAPNGGESWTGGVSQNIQWAASDPAGVDSVSILLSTNGGASYDTTLARDIPNTGSFAWTPPDTVLANCRVRIVSWDAWRNTASDTSAADFAIVRAVGVDEAFAGLVGFALSPAWPNPTHGAVTLRYVAPRAAHVGLAIYDLAGRRVRGLVDAAATTAAGAHDVAWDGRDAAGRTAAPGLYFARLAVGGLAKTERFALVR